jgi:hypothetical protein
MFRSACRAGNLLALVFCLLLLEWMAEARSRRSRAFDERGRL